MKAMILAAGLGTRLRPLTNHTPKALVKVNGIPLLEIVIQKLEFYGFHEIIINVHHFAERIIEFLQKKQNFGIDIHISHEADQLLDTGGGLKKVSWFFDDGNSFLVHNVDVLTNLNLRQMYETHVHVQSLATLAVQNRQSSRYLLFDQEKILCGWKNTATGEIKITRAVSESELTPLAFSGIHIIHPAIFDLMPEQDMFSIITVYLQLAPTYKIAAFNHDNSLWIDLGRKEHLAKAGEILDQIYDFII